MFTLFTRPAPRPTAAERRILTLALLENGDATDMRLYRLFRWAAEPDNHATLDLVLEGEINVGFKHGDLSFWRNVEKLPEWAAEEWEEAIA